MLLPSSDLALIMQSVTCAIAAVRLCSCEQKFPPELQVVTACPEIRVHMRNIELSRREQQQSLTAAASITAASSSAAATSQSIADGSHATAALEADTTSEQSQEQYAAADQRQRVDDMQKQQQSALYDEYLLLACDGLWDVFSSEDAGRYFYSQLQGILFSRHHDRTSYVVSSWLMGLRKPAICRHIAIDDL